LKNIAFIFCLILAHLVNAQVQWAKQIGSPSTTQGEFGQIISDGINTYMVGKFGGNLFLPNDTLFANGSNDIFITKFDANGNNLWSKNIGGNSSSTMDSENGNAVFDPINNCIYLSGHFTNSMYLSGIGYLSGNSDIFLIKMDLDGNFIWAKKAGGNGNDQAQVYVNPYGKIYLVTQSTDSAYFDNFHIGQGGAIVTFDNNGNCLSAERKYNFNFTTDQNSVSISFLGNDIIYYGSYISQIFYLDTTTLNPIGDYDAFIARADSAGKLKWVHSFGADGQDGITSVQTNNNKITFLGVFSDTVNLFGSTLNLAGFDIVLSKIDANGNLKWIKKFDLNSNTIVVGHKIKYATIGENIIVTGFFNGTANFGNLQMTASTSQDMFLAKFDTIGDCLSYFNFGLASGRALEIDNSNNIYVCGNFSNTVNIGNSNFTVYGGSSDIYLAKFNASLGNNTRTAPNNSLIIYANPTKGTCNITIPDDLKSSPNLTLMIYNAQGSLIQKQPIHQLQDKVKLSLDAEAKGMYNVTLSDGYKMYYGKIVFE
jgi:hypothetical protein